MPATCKRCLLRELGDAQYFHSVYELIDALTPEERASDGEYRRRLELCRSCDGLVNGMCRECGCFVEVRAAKAAQRCPGTPARWGAEERSPTGER